MIRSDNQTINDATTDNIAASPMKITDIETPYEMAQYINKYTKYAARTARITVKELKEDGKVVKDYSKLGQDHLNITNVCVHLLAL